MHCVPKQIRSSEMAARLTALPAADAAAACGRWLERTSAEARPALGRLLHGCTDAAALSGCEESLHAAIIVWRHDTPTEEAITGAQPSPHRFFSFTLISVKNCA